MTLDLLREHGTPLERQVFTWKDLVREPISKLDDEAFTRVRLIVAGAVEQAAVRFQHAAVSFGAEHRILLADLRRVEHHQATLLRWLQPADQSPLESSIAVAQAAVEVGAQVARCEPDPYVAQALRLGLLEDFDHLYRLAALMDRLEGRDANAILQSYTDIRPGRPTAAQHRAPEDDLRRWYDRSATAPATKLHARIAGALAYQARDHYLDVGPTFADPVARQLYAELASVKEQHVTQCESLVDPNETWLEKWLLHEAAEVHVYWGCLCSESNPRVRAVWDRFLAYELEHLRIVRELFEKTEMRDASEVVPAVLSEPLAFAGERAFIREVLASEVELGAAGTEFVPRDAESRATQSYRAQLARDGSPSETVAADYRWSPGTELADPRIRDASILPPPLKATGT
ncbi:hypothetical protein [Nannocystis pusilla]|uniref:Uncharacterized protein n=1 Tax=Nannocystis pusilla TaxID=889268 RepID=A0ABS7U332_9BACT|nr:hypothetical protein [Nannocystis pusilla]MBZ5714752.1 hypothetical protein [Nannocystis pusilla]